MSGRHRKPKTSATSIAKIAVAGAVLGGSGLTLAAQACATSDAEWDQVADCESGGNWATDTGNVLADQGRGAWPVCGGPLSGATPRNVPSAAPAPADAPLDNPELNGLAPPPPDAPPPAPVPTLDAPLAPAPEQAVLVDTAVQSPAPADAAIAVPEAAAPAPADAKLDNPELNGLAPPPADTPPPAPVPTLDAAIAVPEPAAPEPADAPLDNPELNGLAPPPADAAPPAPVPAVDAPLAVAEPGDWDFAPAPENQPETWAVHFAESFVGTPYSQANRDDCSGAASQLINFALGQDPRSSFMSTRTAAQWLASRGFVMGDGPPGTLRVGWYNHGSAPNDGHMAITLPDGRHAESGGSHGTFEVGGSAAGAEDSEFNHHAYLPTNDMYPQE